MVIIQGKLRRVRIIVDLVSKEKYKYRYIMYFVFLALYYTISLFDYDYLVDFENAVLSFECFKILFGTELV